MTRDTKCDVTETVVRGIIEAQSASCSHPLTASLINQHTVDLIVSNRCRVGIGMGEPFLLFGLNVTAEQSVTRRQPEVAFAILVDIDDDGIGLAGLCEIICLTVIEAQPFQRGYP